MKKLFLAISMIAFSFLSAQELSTEHKQMLKYDDAGNFTKLVSKENINICYKNEENSYSLLALSIKLNSKKVFQKLLDDKADLEKVCDGKTPLMFAAKYGNAEFAKKLLENGAKKEAKTEKGYTALDYAKKYEKSDVIKLLE
ncbi:ankyrin repeat domain-containing protein [Chryseobacterium wangxinyae]|uniref:ankyrin repeat domain-containing protein n=1 Tax=Chryseobacterium sp. CY350 TaxID=2997336 RepID=UPI00226F1E79|nr:ankyrin repeat domain-containing protein [Chryseobacterium sp. CY350]MCY0978794.1 ankyrin repeat domain-containing protein [Chryseobacterium sp. CY350]WBZ93826.1 ankyrin repeat domain-containing protein [Chryseobacterium sp. CY350]